MKSSKYLPWVTYRGTWHIYRFGESHSLCGLRVGDGRFAGTPVSKLHRCDSCHEKMAALIKTSTFYTHSTVISVD
jgi:hypothetical protein